jgi:hypothetical protein
MVVSFQGFGGSAGSLSMERLCHAPPWIEL